MNFFDFWRASTSDQREGCLLGLGLAILGALLLALTANLAYYNYLKSAHPAPGPDACPRCEEPLR